MLREIADHRSRHNSFWKRAVLPSSRRHLYVPTPISLITLSRGSCARGEPATRSHLIGPLSLIFGSSPSRVKDRHRSRGVYCFGVLHHASARNLIAEPPPTVVLLICRYSFTRGVAQTNCCQFHSTIPLPAARCRTAVGLAKGVSHAELGRSRYVAVNPITHPFLYRWQARLLPYLLTRGRLHVE